MELGRAIPYGIRIEPSSNMGFIVTIRCQVFVATDKRAMIQGLEEYLDDPEGMEKKLNDVAPIITAVGGGQPRAGAGTAMQTALNELPSFSVGEPRGGST